MFNVNLLGAPGIQPETVDDSISFRNGKPEINKPTKKRKHPNPVTNSVKYIKSKGDWIGFILISAFLIYVLGPGSDFLGLENKSLSLEDQLKMNSETISTIISQLEKFPESVSLRKLNTNSESIQLKLSSFSQDELFTIANGLRSCPDGITRINGDSTTVFGLSFESPWSMPVKDETEVVSPIQNSGDLSFTIVGIRQLIEDDILHQGILTIELIDSNNYQLNFNPLTVGNNR